VDSASALDAFVSPFRRRVVSEPTGAGEEAPAGLVPRSDAGVGRTVSDGDEAAGDAGAGGAGGGGSSVCAGFGPP
jgi:hypothetical protein